MNEYIDPSVEFDPVHLETREGLEIVREAEEILAQAAAEPSRWRRLGRAFMVGLSKSSPWIYMGAGVYIPPLPPDHDTTTGDIGPQFE
ncbi:hypothetical protein KC951_03615 [Candidatus Saccharibacteria bacterium]|nr:hypothetical protein [Candidatus Saccharibacteria bacterium]